MSKYDVVIIGGGLGGLECGAILSKEGLNVCVVEKNRVAGGCLQSFRREGLLLDTGIHYIGSMDDGQLLNLYFKYFGVLDSLKMRRLESDGFDVIGFRGGRYPLATGYEGFVDGLAAHFPAERANLQKFCALIRDIGETIGPDVLRSGQISSGSLGYFDRAASKVCEELIVDPTLREVLAGNSALYDGVRNVTPLYHYGTINYSFVAGPYRFEGGSQQLADALVEAIRANGGTVMTGTEVRSLATEDKSITSLSLASGESLEADHFISSLHPAVTFGLLGDTPLVHKARHSRLASMANTRGSFCVWLVMKKDAMPYDNRNYYFYSSDHTWDAVFRKNEKQPSGMMLSMQVPQAGEYAEVVSLLTMVEDDEFLPWKDTTVGRRGEQYEELKARKAAAMLDFAESCYPGLKKCVESVYTSSPLTYRDYTATPGGSAYGVMKDCNAPLANIVPVRTKFGNLLLTGQSLNVHGALGVTVTAALTCAELLGTEYLAKKIGNA